MKGTESIIRARADSIRRLSVDRFKGAVACSVDFLPGANLCVGGVGSGKTRLFDALWLLAMIVRGSEATIARYGWWSSLLPTEIEIEVDSANVGPVTYAVSVRQDGLCPVIVEERLTHSEKLILHRSGGRFRLLDGADFAISNSRFALPSVVARSLDDPIEALRGILRSVWLLSPNPLTMVGGLQVTCPPIDVECRYLAHYIVSQQRVRPQIYGLLISYLKDFGIGPMELSILNDNFGQQYLAVRRQANVGMNAMPFDVLSASEKLLMLAAFVRAINEHVVPVRCVWDDPLNGLGDREGAMVLQSLGRSFGERGQAIFLSQYRSVVEIAGNMNRIEVHA